MNEINGIKLQAMVTLMGVARFVWLVSWCVSALVGGVGALTACPNPMPHGCTCNSERENDISVQCINTNLTFIPDDLPPHTSNMHFKDNDIQVLKSIPYPYLSRLVLDANNIVEIQNGAFQNLSKLTSLSLNDNNINHIETDTFVGLQSLLVLSIKNNQLNSLEDRTFVGEHLKNLQIIELNSCNLTSIASNAFVGMTSLHSLHLGGNFLHGNLGFLKSQYMRELKELNLSKCAIKELAGSSFVDMHSVGSLDLRGNQLSLLSKDSFMGLSNLTTLQLDHNSIHKIEPATFVGMGKLRDLGLSYNQLDTLAKEEFKNTKLRSLALHHNTWRCDCAIYWMRHDDVVLKNNFNQSFLCHDPPDLVNKDFFLVSTADWNCGADKLDSFGGHQTAAVVLGLLAALAGATLLSLLLYRFVVRRRLTRRTIATISGSTSAYRRVNDQGLGMS